MGDVMCKATTNVERCVVCVIGDGLCASMCWVVCGMREIQLEHVVLCTLEAMELGSGKANETGLARQTVAQVGSKRQRFTDRELHGTGVTGLPDHHSAPQSFLSETIHTVS